MKLKRFMAAALAVVMTLSLAACGQKEESKKEDSSKKEAGKTLERPEAVSEEDWEAMQKEPAFGTELNYLFNGGACVSAKYMAEVLGYYEEYGINASYVEGSSVVETVGTGQCMWGTDHIATMLVPITNNVNMTFVAGSHIGCKSIFVPADSDIQTAEDLVGKKIAIHDGIGNSDQNICYRLLDEYGVDPTKDVEFLDINDSAATVAAMESGEVDASIFSDYFVLANYREDMRMICSISYSKEFQDEACCVTAMNNDFIEKNPVHAKYVVKAIKRAGEYNRLNSEEAVQTMFDTNKMTGEKQNQMEFWDSLHFGLSDAFTENALREIAEDYLRLGIITKSGLTVDDVMEMAWTTVCPDEEMGDDYTVGDPVEPQNAIVPIKQKENPVVPENFGLSEK
ncbi:ABC transporter substrate-binding protein [Bariatricus massiliensis]|uniref:ABC transporter substrate-binding protein n=1 Tax=Bariatricus massiliensis TaxID=1745713 RepID=A0ABS8DLJ5_9FIRM|nr:ABC transporter substrate-binding protein [Bariatricus massiliensis]MCB7306123.1 ABC transporter substrate-binding protein [Bariatricus massiliensis]MCB7376668.1 ABC transporter substrate-binding protein [Bariatricus massiliensis]MCB7389326.1 ABC transporter substrate-binding protein [Bariatricus massiliensis]MCB7413487.1 ABC transporter substrate-binding protein [Bariatricus massiliensis]MCQ5254342.1 ABC transporter substrate-binding protein [Bariatricus massiliensis]